MGLKLGGNSTFKDFTEEREVGDGAVVIKVIWVPAWLLQNGRDGGHFKVRGDGAS